eukprot:scaffold23368_cov71-Skeletonema_dohrnii-CCMP3373.AAC.1
MHSRTHIYAYAGIGWFVSLIIYAIPTLQVLDASSGVTQFRSSNDRTDISRALHIKIEGLSRHLTSSHAISPRLTLNLTSSHRSVGMCRLLRSM